MRELLTFSNNFVLTLLRNISKWSLLVFVVLLPFSCDVKKNSNSVNFEKQKSYANALLEKELYSQAIDAYESYLVNGNADKNLRANILYRIGNIYLGKMNDPENALAVFIKIKEFYPRSPIAGDAGKKIVECLEKSGRSIDAQNEISRITSLKRKKENGESKGVVVAEIEDRNITLPKIEKSDGYLAKTRKERKEQVRRYVAGELLYQSAVRKGLERDREIQQQLKRLKRSLLINKLIEEELSKVKIDTLFAEDYYKARKEQYADSTGNKKNPKIPKFREVRSRVLRDMAAEKRKQAYQKLIDRLLQAENTRIFYDKIE